MTTIADYLNAGHVAWRTGKIEKAAELYSKAALEYVDKVNLAIVENVKIEGLDLCCFAAFAYSQRGNQGYD